jgi:hypothetical protein
MQQQDSNWVDLLLNVETRRRATDCAGSLMCEPQEDTVEMKHRVLGFY